MIERQLSLFPKKSKGVICPSCGKFFTFPPYVLANWSKELYLVCKCDFVMTVLRGEILEKIEPPTWEEA